MVSESHRRLLLIFAKEPAPGRVKTRLARELGARAATEIYHELGRRAVERLQGGSYRAVVFYDPPESEPQMRRWLGDAGAHEYLPQPPGDLGARLRYAFDWGFAEGDLVCVVGTDIPDLDRATVDSAFGLLAESGGPDTVIGPALDGGYYLLALRRPAPELFDAIPWSTERVFDQTLERAAESGLRVETLAALSDVDRPEDVPRDLRDRHRTRKKPSGP